MSQKLNGAHIHRVGKRPLAGIIDIETDDGLISLSIDKKTAEDLIAKLQVFLKDPGDRLES